MPLPYQPVRLRYGYKPGSAYQAIPCVDTAVVIGEPTDIYFDEDLTDPYSHHANSGGISIINGPASPNGYWVDGTISLWIRDLWSPNKDHQTEFQVRLRKCTVLPDIDGVVKPNGQSGPTLNTNSTLFSDEDYGPVHYDDLLWDANGNVSPDEPSHTPVNKHYMFEFKCEEVNANERLRVAISQFHSANANGNFLVPGYDMPYPGYIWRAQARLKAWPR
jgi:hypothetical protein